MGSNMAHDIDWTERLAVAGVDGLGGLVVDDTFRILGVADAVLRRVGMSSSAIHAKSVLDLFHPADIDRAIAMIRRATPGDAVPAPGVFRLLSKSGTWDIYEVRTCLIGQDPDDGILIEFANAGVEARNRSLIDDSVELTRLLVEPGASLRKSFRSVSDIAERNVDGLKVSITVFSEDGNSGTFCRHELDESVIAVNAAAHPLSLPPHVVEAFGKAKVQAWRPEDEVGVILPNRPDRMTMVLLDSDDHMLGYVDAYRAVETPPEQDEWRVYRLVAQTLQAVMLHAQLNNRIDYFGKNDPLTGLVNRHSMLERMAQADLEGSGVLVINLDNFSWVNTSLGFESGDTVLASVAASILSAIPRTAVAARLSGDEFLIWMPNTKDADEIFRISEDLRKAIMVPIDNADRRGRTRCSIGSTQAQGDETADAVVHRAAEAMSQAKQAGGDRVSHG